MLKKICEFCGIWIGCLIFIFCFFYPTESLAGKGQKRPGEEVDQERRPPKAQKTKSGDVSQQHQSSSSKQDDFAGKGQKRRLEKPDEEKRPKIRKTKSGGIPEQHESSSEDEDDEEVITVSPTGAEGGATRDRTPRAIASVHTPNTLPELYQSFENRLVEIAQQTPLTQGPIRRALDGSLEHVCEEYSQKKERGGARLFLSVGVSMVCEEGQEFGEWKHEDGLLQSRRIIYTLAKKGEMTKRTGEQKEETFHYQLVSTDIDINGSPEYEEGVPVRQRFNIIESYKRGGDAEQYFKPCGEKTLPICCEHVGFVHGKDGVSFQKVNGFVPYGGKNKIIFSGFLVEARPYEHLRRFDLPSPDIA